MTIKRKVALGVAFLYFAILATAGIAMFAISDLSGEAENILKNNYESLEYTRQILADCDSIHLDSARALASIESHLRLQEGNITEPGELDLTTALRQSFEKIKREGLHDPTILEMHKTALLIQEVNMEAITRKNEITQESASQSKNYVIIISSIVSLITFTFIVNFPGYIANPISQLTNSIKSIANKNYEERLFFNRNDEFEELAGAFNQMAEKLDEYEHSNLANLLFEKSRIETVINQMRDPVIGLDQKKRIVFANEQVLQLINLKRPDVIDRYAPDLAVQNDLLRNLIRIDDSTEKDQLLKIVIDGREHYFSKETTTIIYTPTGEKEKINIGRVILLKDVTPYKERDLAKTNFIATISHELKTPIASIQMCARLLSDNRIGPMNAEQQEIITSLGEETGRLSKLVNELLDLSQVETGNIKLKIESVDPLDLANQAVEAVKFQAERKHVSIRLDAPKELPHVAADFEKTTWVLINLLTNAIRFSPENGNIDIRLQNESNRVSIHVEDSGPGIEEKFLERIFDRFFQVPGTSKGTGLGLAISREFMEAQGGAIHVQSKYGYGSVFTVDLNNKPNVQKTS